MLINSLLIFKLALHTIYTRFKSHLEDVNSPASEEKMVRTFDLKSLVNKLGV